jgi:octaprenyl-diphosphate synthase
MLSGGMEDEIHAMATFGSLLGIAYQIHDDIIERSNEDRLFNLLVTKDDHS